MVAVHTIDRDLTPSMLADHAKCAKDKHYFSAKYLTIKDFATAKPIAFKPNRSQLELSDRWAVERILYCLKPRRQGISREAMLDLFHGALYTPGQVNISLLHDDAPAEEMFTQVREWHKSLPEKMFRFKGSPFEAIRDRGDGIWFGHGGGYVVGSANSLKYTGSHTFTKRHYAEFAKFKNPQQIIRSIEGAATPGDAGGALYETTAEGGGYAWEQWHAKNGWGRLFFPWTVHPNYKLRQSAYPPHITDAVKQSPKIADYLRKYEPLGVSGERITWMIDKLLSTGFDHNHPEKTLRSFNQEYPITPEIAFIVSQGAVFNVKFLAAEPTRGLRIYEQPKPFSAYVLGADAASGSEYGDFCSFVVLDVTNKKRPRVVCTFYDKVDGAYFADECQRIATQYQALVAVGRDAYGNDVNHRMQQNGYHRFYREVKYDRVQGKMTEKLGVGMTHGDRIVLVNLMKEYINDNLLFYVDGAGTLKQGILDERLRYECNGFQYISNDSGNSSNIRAEAVRPFHDDMLFALAHALLAIDQKHAEKEVVLSVRPSTPEQIMHFHQRYPTEQQRAAVRFAGEGGPPLNREPPILFAAEQLFRHADTKDFPH